MPRFSSGFFCVFVVVWTSVFLFLARFFLFSAHESWFQEEERKLLGDVELKIDNLDARNLRQLNQLYAEIKKVEGTDKKSDNFTGGGDRALAGGPGGPGGEDSDCRNCSKDSGEVGGGYEGGFEGEGGKRGSGEGKPDLILDSHRCLGFGNCTAHPHSTAPGNQQKQFDDAATLEPSIAVLVIACDRTTYVKQAIDSLLKYRPSAGLFPIVVSQDCGHEPTANAIASYGNRIAHIKHPNQGEVVIPLKERNIKNRKAEIGYYKIARHYKWALSQVFDEMNYQYVIVVEDDMNISPDFYSYFSSLRFLLDTDPMVWCISAWNDNGKDGYVDQQDNDLLYRTDFFPGLGWLMTRQTWEELKPKWPLKFWDDWMREPGQRKGRACIRPEVSRTKTFGKIGVSSGLYYTQHLQFIVLNSNAVDFSKKNLSYLLEGAYQREFVSPVLALPTVDITDVLSSRRMELKQVQVRYSNQKDFERIAKQLRIMTDFRGGVPRTAYQGIVSIMYRGRRVHLTPPTPWQGYSSLH